MTDNVSRRDLEKAESEWISNPSPMLCARLAEILRQDGRLDESREVAETGLRRWKNNTSINVVLGKCYRESGLLEKAMESFAGVNAAQPQNLVALLNLAEIHFQKKNWSAAINYFEEYSFEQPGDDEVRDKLEEARSMRNSDTQISIETEEDVPEHDSEVFPKTERMNRVLKSQGILKEAFSESEETESDGYSLEDDSFIVGNSPDSLLEFFSDEEKENLHLKPYDGENE